MVFTQVKVLPKQLIISLLKYNFYVLNQYMIK